MEFRISDTFTDSLARLTADEQKAVKTTAFDLQLNPAHPSISLHKIEQSKDKNFWSARVSSDIRLIVHKTSSSFLLCYVDHHDKAYRWAERRKLEVHPKTGAAQWVEIRERVEERAPSGNVTIAAASPTTSKPAKTKGKQLSLFAQLSDDELLAYGVPTEWLADVKAADEDALLELAEHLPAEAAEALLEIATGGKPVALTPDKPIADPFAHPDAQRRFRVMKDVEELAIALNFPWEKWTTFLHPSQRQLVEKDYAGPARISGSAGTGKTIVALHRAVHLVKRFPESRVLLTTFSESLAHALGTKLRRLIGNEPRLGERLEVLSMDAVGERLYERHFGRAKLASAAVIQELMAKCAAADPELKFGTRFLVGEWVDLVDAWQLDSWEAYRDVRRLGRKTRLSEPQRQSIWAVFERLHDALSKAGLTTRAAMFSRLAQKLADLKNPPFDFAVVDEAQDISVSQLKFLAAMGQRAGKMRANSLMFTGDLGQRIFQQPFSWKSLGVDIRGRSRTLTINYRTSHQIRAQADKLLGPEVSDVDGNTESRKGTISVFNGPAPEVRAFKSEAAEVEGVAAWLKARVAEGLAPHELGVFVRDAQQVSRAEAAMKQAGVPRRILDEHVETAVGTACVCTMHLAKGLEFRAVVVMACDDEVIPSQSRIESVTDEADLEEVYNTERHLLYVACTRARDRLLVTSGGTPSEFLEDLN